MRQIAIFKEARSILPRKGNKNFIIDAKDRKLFIRVINICPQRFGLKKCCTEKGYYSSMLSPRKNVSFCGRTPNVQRLTKRFSHFVMHAEILTDDTTSD